MKVVGMMKVRDEQWVLGCSLPAAMLLCDELVVLDHLSTDRTTEIIEGARRDFGGRVHRFAYTETEWLEADMREVMLERARGLGGTHFVCLDADEIVTGNLVGRFRGMLADLEAGQGLWLPWLAMWQSLDAYRDDESVWSNNSMLFGFRDGAGVGFRAEGDGYDIHARAPKGLIEAKAVPVGEPSGGGVFHLQFANRRRLIAKHAWYKMVETVRWPGRMAPDKLNWKYNRAVNDRGVRTATAPESWWGPYDGLRELIDADDSPWHEREIVRLWREHGAETFAGLGLWGLPERLIAESEAAHAA